MKSLVENILIILAMMSVVTLSSCGGNDEEPCTPPIEIDSVQPEHGGMLRHIPGDTIYFKKYQVSKDSGRRYVYLGEENFIAGTQDTQEVIYYRNNHTYKCDTKVLSYPIAQGFSGGQSLKCQLVPDGLFDDLQILFAKKDFRMDNLVYNNPNSFFHEKLVIGGKEYSNVNYCAGYDVGSYPEAGAYKDSTIAFYNDDYGLLRFIINDVLVYERELR
jgi:hypothetical protein